MEETRLDKQGLVYKFDYTRESIVVNNVSKSKCKTENVESIIDFTMASERLTGNIKEWKTLEDKTLNNHLCIYVGLTKNLYTRRKTNSYVKRKKGQLFGCQEIQWGELQMLFGCRKPDLRVRMDKRQLNYFQYTSW